jgi:hypothetical protein
VSDLGGIRDMLWEYSHIAVLVLFISILATLLTSSHLL